MSKKVIKDEDNKAETFAEDFVFLFRLCCNHLFPNQSPQTFQFSWCFFCVFNYEKLVLAYRKPQTLKKKLKDMYTRDKRQ